MAPVVEDPTSGHFLTEEPYDIFNQGTFNKVPIVIGFTQDEAAYIMDDSSIKLFGL